MQITNNDVFEIDNKMKENYSNIYKFGECEEYNFCDKFENPKGQYYNPNLTLRKCASRLLDRISVLYPKLACDFAKPILEIELQCEDWIKKYKL